MEDIAVFKESLDKMCVRTSDCRSFRRCLRKWKYTASMKNNLTGSVDEMNDKFWFGSAIHFAMEDYFGENKFGDPRAAFEGYYKAHEEIDKLPDGVERYLDLGMGMLAHFIDWWSNYNLGPQFETIWVDKNGKPVSPHTTGARPLIEESFELALGVNTWINIETNEIVPEANNDKGTFIMENREEGIYRYYNVSDEVWEEMEEDSPSILIKQVPVHYHGTVDRIVRDAQGRVFLVDYKTAAAIDTNKLENDDQVTRYLWAMEQWLGIPIDGFVYIQLVKDVPKPLRLLKNGEFSVDKNQRTTSGLVRKALADKFGSVQAAPKKYIDFLNEIVSHESTSGNKFIDVSIIYRTKEQKMSAYYYIMNELNVMLHMEDSQMYPTPTRDCYWDCDFRDLCILEDNLKFREAITTMASMFERRPLKEREQKEEWREKLVYPDEPYEIEERNLYYAEHRMDSAMDIILPEQYQ